MQYFKKLIGDRIYLSPKGALDEEVEKFTEWMNEFEGEYIRNKNIK